jgi:signal transduction histidine kinase
LLDSFDKEFPPLDAFKATLRTEFRKLSSQRLVFYELSLQPASAPANTNEESFLRYVLSTFKGQELDLIVTVGGPAARFAHKHRDRLFPSTPLLLAAVDERYRDKGPTSNSTAVAVVADPSLTLRTIMQILPETKHIAVVIGSSPIEQFWRKELERDFRQFKNRLTFTWFDELSYAEILNRSGTLPPGSAIFYSILSIDGKGELVDTDTFLTDLHTRANAPIFGIHSPQLGYGVVGGPMLAIEELSRKTAGVAVRLLEGEAPENIKVPPQVPGPTVFDGRELRRWNISKDRLPTDSIIRFESPTAWDEYKRYVLAGGSLAILQTLLVVGLATNLVKRKRVERSLRAAEKLAQDFSRRLIQAQETERAHLAREIHDDMSQRMVALQFDLQALMNSRHGDSLREDRSILAETSARMASVTTSLRQLSHRLHPAHLQLLGITDALRDLQHEMSTNGVKIAFSHDNMPDSVPPDVMLCLYRLAQEALRNALKHSGADEVLVHLQGGQDLVMMRIQDNGVGFDPGALHKGLGLISMSERVQILGGRLNIQSQPGHGTTISAWIPLNEEHAPTFTDRFR